VTGLLFLSLALAAAPAATAQDTSPRWDLSVSASAGEPGGWTRVRENAIAGTRLGLRSALDLRASGGTLEIARRLGDHRALRLRLDQYTLSGTVTPAQDILYNGTTITGGLPLQTRTAFPYFVRGTVTYESRLGRPGGTRLDWTAGLTYVALTFKMNGTIAAASVGHETQEDFVTQELPVPIVGLRASRSLGTRWEARAGAAAGYLPWVNSLRQEGGEVRLQQSHLDLWAGVTYRLTRAFRITAEYRYTGFAQHESSAEDGNDVVLRQHALGLGLAVRW